MQELERMINIYHIASIVFLVLTIVFLALTVFLFFKFDIRKIIDIKTGRGERRSIQKMEEINARTGKLRQGMTSHTTAKLRAEDRITYPVTEQNPRVHSEAQNQNTGAASGTVGQRSQDYGSQQTEPLDYMGVQETTILNDSSETTILYQDSGTTVLSGEITEGKPRRKKIPGTFTIEKEIMWVHTNEVL